MKACLPPVPPHPMSEERSLTAPFGSPVAGQRLLRHLHAATGAIVGGYLALGLVWLLAGDRLLGLARPEWAQAHRQFGLEATLFVLVSAALLYAALRQLSAHWLGEHLLLAQSATRLHEKFHALPCPVWAYDLSSLQIVDANPAALAFFGYSRDEFLALRLDAIWPTEGSGHLADIIDKLRASPDEACVMTEPLVTRDGLRHVEIRSSPLDLPAGPARLVVATDRSAERHAERQRAELLHLLEEAQAIARVGSWELDPVTCLGRFSTEVYRILGRPAPPSNRGHRFEELLAGVDLVTQVRIDRLIDDMCGPGNVQIDVLLPVVAGDGQGRLVHLRAESGSTDDGRRRVHGTLQDVTEREQSRRLLREREEQFRELVRVLPDGVMILSEERVMYANAACAAQFGFPGEALLGEPLSALVGEHDLALVRDQMEADPALVETFSARRMRRRDQSLFRAGLSVGSVRYGGRDCRLLVVRDLSEPERMRDELAVGNAELQAMAKRLFSLQEDERAAISRDLHDDIGQAITAMKLSAHAAIDEDDVQQRRENIEEIVQLADTTVTKLRNLSMLLRPPQLDALGLEAALRWQASSLFRGKPQRLEMDVRALGQRPSNEIEQACFRIAQESLTNVLRHACAGEVSLLLHDQAERGLYLEVADDGDGFEPEAPRGLGLIVMRERAQTVGGTLTIESSPGNGTRVRLHLPYQAAGEPAPANNGR
ncbi:MAG TPA: PAS domain S-box protein [Stenotrophomonas sp.]|jgi:PAS domain S-box-containing protein